MKKTIALVGAGLLVVFALIVVVVLSPTIQNTYWTFRELIEPNINQRIESEWRVKPTSYLLGKLKSKVIMHSGTAAQILVERKEKASLPIFWEYTKSKDKQTRISAFTSIGMINDSSSIEPLMEIVKKGELDENYLDALNALAIMHYEPIYEEILKLSKAKKYNTWIIDMIAKFPEKMETFIVLEDISKHDNELIYRLKAERVLADLKEAQGR